MVRHDQPSRVSLYCQKGQSAGALPQCVSDTLYVDLLRNRQRVVDFDPEVSPRAFDLPMPQEKLNGVEVASSPIDQGRFGSAKRVGAEELGIQSDFCDPR